MKDTIQNHKYDYLPSYVVNYLDDQIENVIEMYTLKQKYSHEAIYIKNDKGHPILYYRLGWGNSWELVKSQGGKRK